MAEETKQTAPASDEATADKEEKKVEEKEPELKTEEKREEPKKEVKAEEPKTEVKAEKSKEKETEEVEVPKKFKKLVEEIEKMSVLDLAELVKILEKKFGVSAAAPVAVAAVAGGAEAGGAEEEKDSFNVELTETGSNKIGVIKVIREITQQGLKECKDMADNAPSVVKEGVKKEEAEEMKKKLEEAGAKVTLK